MTENMGTKTEEKSGSKSSPPPEPKQVPNVLSRSFFCWVFPLFYFGNRRDLEEYDLVPPKQDYNSKFVGDQLERVWHEEEKKARMQGKQASFTRVLIKTFGWSFVPGGLMQFLSIGLKTISPLLFSELLKYWSVDSEMSRDTAMTYALLMILSNWLSSYANHHGLLFCQQFGMKLRVATGSLMFRKIMRMSNGSLGETTAGKVVNLLSNDLQRFDLATMFLHYVWIIPIQLAAVVYLGYLQAGDAALIGFASLVIIALPIQGVLGKALGAIRLRTAEKTDERIKLMSEVINGIQVIKMYAWEIPFQKVVGEKRAKEMSEVVKGTRLRTVFIGFMQFTERSALFITVLMFVLFGNSMSANVFYPLQQFMNAAQINITLFLPLVITFTAELYVSLGRVQEFLSLQDRPDLSEKTEYIESSNLFRNLSTKRHSTQGVRPLSYQQKSNGFAVDEIAEKPVIPYNRKFSRSVSVQEDCALKLHDVSASWTGDPNMMAIKNVSMRLRKGKLCAIIGPVGSGKSSILQLLLKELPPATGSVSIYGQISYACQEAWLFPSTVRENILFGLPYEPEKYKKVCKVCTLEKDFKQFPYGDQTLVGERGVSLSGGQRARINLARAVYREADIYLLDDPLSAVDANVGRLLFEGCINGYLRKRTRILVTHQIHFLKAADFIVVMNEGRIENMGTFDELVGSGKDFAMMLAGLQEGKDKDAESMGSHASVEEKSRPALKTMASVISANEGEDLEEFEEQKKEQEERSSGNLRWEVILTYFKSGGNLCFVLFTVSVVLIAIASGASVDYWVSYWTNQMAIYEASGGGSTDSGPNLDEQVGLFTTGQYLIIHGSLVLACIFLTNMRVFPFARLCNTASINLHNNMFSTMLRGVMRFFDTSDSGRILNRFTKDMGALDEILPRTLLDVIQMYGSLAAIFVLNAIALYWTLVPSAVLGILFFFMVRVYKKAAQGIKRLEGTTKSPMFGVVTSSLNGIATIRSSNSQDRLINQFDTSQDLHSSAWNCFLSGGATFGFYLDTVCLVYLTAVIFVFLFLDFGESVPVGSVGLAVTQSNVLVLLLPHAARVLVEFLAQLTSVERILQYTHIDTEPNLFQGKIDMPPTWPSRGSLVFQNVSMRYAPTEAPVLKNLNIVVESGWKVGIVGRTGAGKSSLISALFRFAHIEGSISIDGIDTSLISRQGLRSKISIIPQEPILFSASIRYNLDPFSSFSDDDLWRALEQVDLKPVIPSLDFKVTEGGSNFSVGQRQLMCLARAVLRSNQILIMDEATANVDPQTDNFIQDTIRRRFASCTVLTIAHRLNTIMDSDRVLVMSSGEVAEFDHPYVLLSDPNSQFSSMVRETGEKNSENLLRVAKDAYFQSNLKENAR